MKRIIGTSILSLLIILLLVQTTNAPLSALDYFFEAPRDLLNEHCRYPTLLSSGTQLLSIYQRVRRQSDSEGLMSIELRSSSNGAAWSNPTVLVDAIEFNGITIPQIYQASKGNDGSIAMVVQRSANSVNVYRLSWNGTSFTNNLLATIESPMPLASARVFRRSDGSWLLFAERSEGDVINNSINIVWTQSDDGLTWAPLSIFENDLKSTNLNPSYVEFQGKDMVVFQGLDTISNASSPTNQLYARVSSNKGQSWSEANRITTFVDLGSTKIANTWNNTRPYLTAQGNRVILTWERNNGISAPQAAFIQLNSQAQVIGQHEIVSGTRVAASPRYIEWQGQDAVIWFSSTASKSQIFLSRRSGKTWEQHQFSGDQGMAVFPSAVVHRNLLHIAYHNRANAKETQARLVYIEPDTSAPAPVISAVQIAEGGRTRLNQLDFRLRSPNDPSGIAGYAWIIDRNADTQPVPKSNYKSGDLDPSFNSSQDGDYWFHARTQDNAGNWSSTSHFRFNLDLSPPAAVTITPVEPDEKGIMPSNSFTLSWTAPSDPDTLRYRYSFSYLGDQIAKVPDLLNPTELLPSASDLGNKQEIQRTNVENGNYQLTVWTVDTVGNVGEPAYAFYRFNRFIPSTIISRLELTEDEIGDRFLNIIGRGYTAEGQISSIILDQDKLEPWDYQFFLDQGNYRIISDRRIEGLRFANISTGVYHLGLSHPKRGMGYATELLNFPGQGAVKFGDFALDLPRAKLLENRLPSFQVRDFVFILILALIALLIPLAIIRLRAVTRELQILQIATLALTSGRRLPGSEMRREVTRMRRHGLSLRIKFTLFFITLVVAVVLIVALPLAEFSQRNQRETLARGLKDRIEVIMESLVSGAAANLTNPARNVFAENNFINLLNLTDQASALAEASYVTISGKGSQGTVGYDIIWATSDPELLRESNADSLLDGAVIERYPVLQRSTEIYPITEGRSQVKDQVAALQGALETEINSKALANLADLPQQEAALQAEARTIASATDDVSALRRQEVSREQRAISKRIADILNDLASPSRSVPEFDVLNYDPSHRHYLFYKPVLFRTDEEGSANPRYYQGLVRLAVDTQSISASIEKTQGEIFLNIAIFAAIALIGGLIGALTLSSIIIIPIRRLVKGVEHIRDVADKESLMSYSVGIKSKDELETLGNVIDQMAHGLAKAAASNKELLVGKDVQKMFIPLEQIGKSKGTTGRKVTDFMEVFGYYEGAKGVSGDYFTYVQLNKDTFAFIKCDVSGKGVPAALIMVQVATIFLDYFNDWENKVHNRTLQQKRMGIANPIVKPDLSELVLHINDLIADVGFEGRFAAFNIVLFNQSTGEMTFCNAGDNLVPVYRRASGTIETLKLNKSPASGMFSSKIMPISFVEEEFQLHSGDMLILVTDGVEESKFFFMNDRYELEAATQGDIDAGLVPADTLDKQEAEEFGNDRVNAILEAVGRRDRYTLLRKYKNPDKNEQFVFDFGDLEGSIENTIMALMSVEKMYRIIQDPKAGEGDIINVDKKIDAFLSKIFVPYRQVFVHRLPDDPESLYVRYSHLREFSQYDDLTIIGIKKK